MVADVGELYGSLSERLLRIVGKQIHAPSVVIEDACQFAWYRLVYHAARIDEKTALPWLARTAIREAVKLARRDQRDLSLECQLDETGEMNVAAWAPGPHEQAESKEQLDLVRHLSVRQQRFLWLQAAGYSREEISVQHPGLTRRTIERQLVRGRSRLRAAA